MEPVTQGRALDGELNPRPCGAQTERRDPGLEGFFVCLLLSSVYCVQGTELSVSSVVIFLILTSLLKGWILHSFHLTNERLNKSPKPLIPRGRTQV